MPTMVLFSTKNKSALLLVLFSVLVIISGCDDNPVEPAATEINPFEQNKSIGKGINIGNALEAPNEGDWGIVIQPEYLNVISEAGFTSVRIPIRWSAHADETEPFTIHESFFRRIDWVIDAALSYDLAIIINMHHYDELMSDPYKHRERFLEMWRQISNRYKGKSEKLFYELLNEPTGNMTTSLWNDILGDAVNIIRNYDSERTIIISASYGGGIDGLVNLQLPRNEKNLILTFHYYSPFKFTHQGAEWIDDSYRWIGTKWYDTPLEKLEIIKDFQRIVSWADVRAIPVNLGEFGTYERVDINSRIAWTNFISQLAEHFQMSWNYWEFGAGFGIYDIQAETWNDDLLEALL